LAAAVATSGRRTAYARAARQKKTPPGRRRGARCPGGPPRAAEVKRRGRRFSGRRLVAGGPILRGGFDAAGQDACPRLLGWSRVGQPPIECVSASTTAAGRAKDRPRRSSSVPGAGCVFPRSRPPASHAGEQTEGEQPVARSA